MIQKPILALAVGVIFALTVSGCKPSCDIVPTETPAQVRIFNAVSNSSLLLVYVDGKLFDSAWYDIDNKYYSWNRNHTFGYRTTYLPSGLPLHPGLHHVAAMDATSRDTVSTWDGILRGSRQSLIFIGKMNSDVAHKPSAKYLDDVVRNTSAQYSYARFVDAVVDIQGLDVYFSTRDTGKPSISLAYGTISDAQGGDKGTGLSANDYFQIPPQDSGLLIQPEGDTSLNDNIFSSTYGFSTNGLLLTIVARGETKPVGADPTASMTALEDGNSSAGTVTVDIQNFGVSLVNATHYDSLSLMISNPNDQNDLIPRTITNKAYGTQQKVTIIPPDSVSEYMALSTLAIIYYNFWFGFQPYQQDTVFHFTSNPLGKVPPLIIPTLEPNFRYTFVAIDTIAHDASNAGISLLELFDTVSVPGNVAIGRVRFVNTTADYTASFTVAGQSFSMAQRNVQYVDAPAGPISFQVNGGAATGTVTFNLSNATPATVFFFPADASDTIPYRVSTQ
jgi:hypothetical protein